MVTKAAEHSYSLKMPGLQSASYSDSSSEKWVLLTFTGPRYIEITANILNSVAPYQNCLKCEQTPNEYRVKIKSIPLPDSDLYKIKSAVQIIHFLNKNFDSNEVRKPVDVMRYDDFGIPLQLVSRHAYDEAPMASLPQLPPFSRVEVSFPRAID